MNSPTEIRDELGRVYLTKYDSKSIFRKFRGDSKVIKSIYHITGDLKKPRTFEVDFINKEGTEIVANYSNILGFKFKASGFVGFSSKDEFALKFPVDNEIIKEWIIALKN
tara:strand:- start:568 stop:897 length:330 start_codon:yes stop_codon:yes gene_type:complete